MYPTSPAFVQPDLFGQDDEANQARLIGALEALRDEDPNTIGILALGHRRPKRGDCRAGYSGGRYAYGPQLDGYHWQDVATWPGFTTLPANVVSWDELDELIAGPHLDQVRVWAESLTAPERWRDHNRPYELWPNPEQWHPHYIADDHARPGWPARNAAWSLLRDLLTDVIDRLQSNRQD